MRARARVTDAIVDATKEALSEALERGRTGFPLPAPPRQDPEFPARHPRAPEQLVEQGVGLMLADRGLLDRHLMEVVDLIVPHRMSLTDDPFEVHERWILRRAQEVARRLLFSITSEWFAAALDPHAPDTDRWWLAVATLDGLCTDPWGLAVHHGYHMIESIAIAERPGGWHTQAEVGPQHMEWNPNASAPRMTDLEPHEAGAEAARWFLRRAEEGDSDRRRLAVAWCRLLLERRGLTDGLELIPLLLRRAADPDVGVAVDVVGCLVRVLDTDADAGRSVIDRLVDRPELPVRRAMSDVLTRLFRRIGDDAVPLLERMLEDEDENVLAAAASTVGDLRFLDEVRYADEVARLTTHASPVVRRSLVGTLRDYVERFPEDDRGVLATLWEDGDEVVGTRLRELLLRMEEIDPSSFARSLDRIATANEIALNSLWEVMAVRRAERIPGWKAYLDGGDPPAVTAPKPSRPMGELEPELPPLDDAFDLLGPADWEEM